MLIRLAHDVEAAHRPGGRGRGQRDLRGPEHRYHDGGRGGAAHPIVAPAGELLGDPLCIICIDGS